ncbi:MAG: Gmad2 immunoglobulin-like domain-containing protein [Candidatus Paceibacterota bacterium]|jgi:hypothetical protein
MAVSKNIKVSVAIFLIAVAAAGALFCWQNFFPAKQGGQNNGFSNLKVITKNNFLEVTAPEPYQKITSPVSVSGNSNFFETNTRIIVKDEAGKILADTFTNANGWMDKLYPFLANVFYNAPSSPRGVIEVFENSAKDGSEQNKISIPVIFSDYQLDPQKSKIDLYYYNKIKDQELDPAIGCSKDAVLPVEREVGITKTPIQDAVDLLLKGGLTESEKQEGFFTEFPLEGFSLKGANLKNGLLTLEFEDNGNKTTGGSCRVGLLWAQIEKTVKQFPGVDSVSFQPDTLFQP